MRHFLWIFAVVNLLMFYAVVGGLFPKAWCICSIVGVLICGVVAYSSARGGDARSPQLRVLLASVFALPLCIVLFCIILLIGFHSLVPQCRFLIMLLFAIVLGAYYIIPTYVGIAYVAITIGFLGFAFYYRTFGLYKRTLSPYAVVTLFFVTYILWWYLTGQKWSFL